MRTTSKHAEQHRVAGHPSFGNNGAFQFRYNGADIYAIVSEGAGWDHASVSIVGETRSPTWHEMCYVKDVFWQPEECVAEFHPPRSDYINLHPHVLHLWKQQGVEQELPPTKCV